MMTKETKKQHIFSAFQGRESSQPSVLSFVWQAIKPFKVWLFLLVFGSAVWAVNLSLRPYVLKSMVDLLGQMNFMPRLTFLGGIYIGLLVAEVIAFRLYDIAWLKLNAPLKSRISTFLIQRLMRHSHIFYQENSSGNQGSRVHDVMTHVPDFVQILLDKVFGHLLALSIACFTLWQINFVFSVSLCVWVCFFVAGGLWVAPRAEKRAQLYASKKAVVIGTMMDVLTNMVSVRFFKGFSHERGFLKGKLSSMVKASQNRDWFLIKVLCFQGVSFALYQGVCIFYLINGVDQGLFSAGDFALILTVNGSIISFLWTLTKDATKLTELVGIIRQGLSMVYKPIEITDGPDAVPLLVTKGEITFENVRFHYKGAEPLFQNNSVTILPGQKVGLVGYSGSGKTTFINLILRLFDVKSGKILIDGQDIKGVTQASLREQISVIPQNPLLFNRSVMENIRYGAHQANDDEVIGASKKAFSHSFIKKLAEGYQTIVGERGSKLSGGQRQRIAIARAILKNAPILILDEATSELDTVTEKDIQKSLHAAMRKKTTLVVAHRLTTLMSMDRILVFDRGNIVEDGSHEDLLAQDSLYKKLWSAQEGYLVSSKRRVSSKPGKQKTDLSKSPRFAKPARHKAV